MKIIKKYWYFIVLIILLVVSFLFYLKSKNKKVEDNIVYDNNTVVEYAKEYFDSFALTSNINEYEVTVKMLKDAVNNNFAKYDLNELNKCEDDSYVRFVIKQGETGYESFESKLICKK